MLKPKRAVQVFVNLFGLYPVAVADPVQASRRLRGRFYRGDALTGLLPPTVRNERDRFHAAVDFLVPVGTDTTLNVVVGAVGPPQRGSFFGVSDSERDSRWWMGFRVERRRADEAGIDDAPQCLSETLDKAFEDYEHITEAALAEILQ